MNLINLVDEMRNVQSTNQEKAVEIVMSRKNISHSLISEMMKSLKRIERAEDA